MAGGLSRNCVSLLELDRKSPTVATLMRLCRATGTRASVMLAGVERRADQGRTRRDRAGS